MDTLNNIWAATAGKKTYIAAAVLIAVAVWGFWQGTIFDTQTVILIALALGLAGMGHKGERIATSVVAIEKALKAGDKNKAVAEAIGAGISLAQGDGDPGDEK